MSDLPEPTGSTGSTGLTRAKGGPAAAFPYPPSGDSRTPTPQDASAVLLEGVNLKELAGVLRRHWLLVLGTMLVAGAVVGGYFYLQPPRYVASALIRLTNPRGAIAGGIVTSPTVQEGGPRIDPTVSQIEVIRGRRVLGRVIDESGVLRLAPLSRTFDVSQLDSVHVDSAVVSDTISLSLGAATVRASGRAGTQSAAYGQPLALGGVRFAVRRGGPAAAKFAVLPRDNAIDRLFETVSVTPRELSDAIDISYAAADPALAQHVVNHLIHAYQDVDIESAQRQSRLRREFLAEQLRATDSVLNTAQSALSSFRSSQRVYSTREKISAEQQGLLNLQVRQSEIKADRDMVQGLLSRFDRSTGAARDQLLRSLVSSPVLASNAVVTQLYTQLTTFQMRRDSATSGALRSTNADPDVDRLNTQIARTQDQLVDAVRSYVATLTARAQALDALHASSSNAIQALPGLEANEVRLVQQTDAIRRVSDQLRDELQKARIAEAVEAGQIDVVYLAPLPLEPMRRHLLVRVGLALLLGLVLGSAGAFVREHLNTSVRRREDLERVLRVPGLATIPHTLPPKVGMRTPPKGHLVARSLRFVGLGNGRAGGSHPAVGSYSPSGEAYRVLRTNLSFSHGVRPFRALVVTSAFAGDGKTTIATNLAITFAQQGRKVLLVDCDLRRGRLHEVFGVTRAPGLTDVIQQRAEIAPAVRLTGVNGLSVLPAGLPDPNPTDLLAGERTRILLERLREVFDLVVFDTPPVLAAADPAILGRIADGALFVVRAGRTERAAAQQALEQLRLVNVYVVGAVLNDPEGTATTYQEYYYGSEAVTKG